MDSERDCSPGTSFIEMEKSDEIERHARQSQRDAERMRVEEKVDQDGRDRVPRHVPEPDTSSEIDLTRHKHFLKHDRLPEDMRHVVLVDPETDYRAFALLDDGCNRTCHTRLGACYAKYGFNKVNQDLGHLITTKHPPQVQRHRVCKRPG